MQAALSAERELAWLEVTSTRIVPASIAWASARAIVCHRVQEIMWEPSSAAHNMAQTSSQLAGIAAAAGESPPVYIRVVIYCNLARGKSPLSYMQWR